MAKNLATKEFQNQKRFWCDMKQYLAYVSRPFPLLNAMEEFLGQTQIKPVGAVEDEYQPLLNFTGWLAARGTIYFLSQLKFTIITQLLRTAMR